MSTLLRAIALAVSLLLFSTHVTHAAPATSFASMFKGTTLEDFKRGVVIDLGANGTVVQTQHLASRIGVYGNSDGSAVLDKNKFRFLLSYFNMADPRTSDQRPTSIQFWNRLSLPEDSSELFANWSGDAIWNLGALNGDSVRNIRGFFKNTKLTNSLGSASLKLENVTDYSEFCLNADLFGSFVDLTVDATALNKNWDRDCNANLKLTQFYNLGASPSPRNSIKATLGQEYSSIMIRGSGHLDKEAFLKFRESMGTKSYSMNFIDPIILPSDSSELFKDFKDYIYGLDKLDTSKVTDMSSMFEGTTNSFIRVSRWDVRNVRNFSSMFANSTQNLDGLAYWRIHPDADITNMLGDKTVPGTLGAVVNPFFSDYKDPVQDQRNRDRFKSTLDRDSSIQPLVAQLKGVNAPFSEQYLRLGADYAQKNPNKLYFNSMDLLYPGCGGTIERRAECILSMVVYAYYPKQQHLDQTYKNRVSVPAKNSTFGYLESPEEYYPELDYDFGDLGTTGTSGKQENSNANKQEQKALTQYEFNSRVPKKDASETRDKLVSKLASTLKSLLVFIGAGAIIVAIFNVIAPRITQLIPAQLA